MRRQVLLALALAAGMPAAAFAIDGRLLDAAGKPLAGALVSVAGRPGAVRTGAAGQFVILPDPLPADALVVVGPHGEIYPPIALAGRLPAATLEIRLDAALAETVTVSAGAAPSVEAPPAAGTSVVGREELAERRPEHLVDALERVPGSAVRGEGAAAVPVLRGLSGGRTLVLVDDARVTSERRAGASATFLDPFVLAAVEVVRGPGSVAYGSDAFGGVLHARTREPVPGEEELRWELGGSAGGSALGAVGVSSTHDVAGGALLATVHARRGGNGRDGGGAAIDNSSFEDAGAALAFVRHAEAGTVRLRLSFSLAEDTGAPAAASASARTKYPRENSTRLTLGWDAARPPLGLTSLELRLALADGDVVTRRERLGAQGNVTERGVAEVTARDAGLRLIGTRSGVRSRVGFGIDIASRFGLEARGVTTRFDAGGGTVSRERETSIDGASKIDAGLFVLGDHMLLPWLTLSGGVRADAISVRNEGGSFGARSRSDTAVSAQAAVTVGPFADATLTLQAASGYREPSLSDRYFRGVSGRGFAVGNPDLEPERSVQTDALLRWSRGGVAATLAGYRYRIEDLVERYRVGADFRFRNRGEAVIEGVEAEVAAVVGHGVALHLLGATARGEAENGAALDDIAPVNARAGGRWTGGRGSIWAEVAYSDRDRRPGPVETERPANTTVDCGGVLRLGQALTLHLAVRNVLDERYAGSADAEAAQAPGRTLALSIGGRWPVRP